MKRVMILVAAFSVSTPAISAELDEFSLGRIIGSEKACGYVLDQTAIVSWIETSAPERNADFAHYMSISARSIAEEVKEFGDVQKAAHCAQTQKVAKSYGFVK